MLRALGQNIRTLRHRKGWNQEELASRVGISTPALSKIETGVTDVNLSRVEQIARVFEISIIDLLTLNDPDHQNNLAELESLHKKLTERETELACLYKKVIQLYEDLERSNRSAD